MSFFRPDSSWRHCLHFCSLAYKLTHGRCSRIRLFRERLSEEVHATIPKGIVGGFEFTVLPHLLESYWNCLFFWGGMSARMSSFNGLRQRNFKRFSVSFTGVISLIPSLKNFTCFILSDRSLNLSLICLNFAVKILKNIYLDDRLHMSEY